MSSLPLTIRIGLAIAAAALILSALVVRRRARFRVAATIALLAGATLALIGIAEAIVGLWVTASKAGGDFDEVKWIFSGPWGPLGRVAAIVATLAIVSLSWISSARLESPLRRALLVGLRAAAVLAALCLFFQPAIELRQVTREPNRLAVLIDDSASMALADRPGRARRIDRAKEIVARSAGTFNAWRNRHRVDLYRFSETAAPTDPSLEALTAEGRATHIRKGLEDIRARYRGRDLAGVVLISDGVATGELATDLTGEIDAFLRSLDAPVHSILAAEPGLIDVSVAAVAADEFAFVRTVFSIEATIRTTGLAATRIKVILSGDGAPLRTKWVDVPADGETKVKFEMTPSKLGRFVYEVEVPAIEGEIVVENNRRPFVVRVIRDKIRVLQVAGSPSWDVRALRGMLKQNPNVDLISFFILRTDRSISLASNDELSLIRFPTRELFLDELPSFDLVILQNFNFGPYGIEPYLENIREYVFRGGALAVLGGPLALASGGYSGTPIDAALPVTLPSGTDLVDEEEFRPKLTDAGRAHPITSLRFSAADNAKEWAALPLLEGINRVRGLRSGSVSLVVHPRERAGDGSPAPVIVSGQYGDGRTLAVLTDSLWRWSFVDAQTRGSDGRSYLKFWENATRWLLDDPDYRYLRVEASKVSYEPGHKARLGIRLLGRDYLAARGQVNLKVSRGADSNTATVVAEAVVETDDAGSGFYDIADLAPGVYRAEASSDVEGYRADARDLFVVLEASAEKDHPAAKPDILSHISLVTGGEYLGVVGSIPASLRLGEPRIVRVDSRRALELWSAPWWLFIAVLLLGFEWLLRQKWGYR